MTSPTICLFSDTVCDANGVSRFINDLAAAAQADNLYVLTATKKTHCKKLDNIIILPCLVKSTMPFYKELDIAVPNYFKLKEKVLAINPKLIIISTPGPIGFMGLRIANRLGIKKVAIYHTDFPSYIYDNTKNRFLHGFTNRFMRYFYGGFDRVYSRSRQYVPNLTNQIGLPQEKIAVLKAGIAVHNFSPSFAGEGFFGKYGLDTKSKKLLYVGRLSKEKNFDFLVSFFKALRAASSSKIDLICCGEGKPLADKDAYANDGIHLLGYKDKSELAPIYANSDLFVFPSVTDTLGQVVMEAMASALPVIVSDKGGPKTLLSHGKEGLIVPVEQKRWVDAARKLLEDIAAMQQMGWQGRQTMMPRSFAQTYTHFKSLNRQVLQG